MTHSSDRSRLRTKLQSAESSLLENGYAIIDHALSDPTLELLHAQMTALRNSGGLRQHRFGFKRDAGGPAQIYTKPCIFEAELSDAAVQRDVPELVDALSGLNLQACACAAFPSLALSSNPDGAATKLQCNEGGCFPLHYDNAGPPSKRKLTALFYLNKGWCETHGGELLLCPWLRPSVRVPPLYGRLVLFQSDVVLHRVLPWRSLGGLRRRFCFTIWLDGEGTNQKSHLQLDARSVPGDSLRLHPAQRLLSRAVYAEEYAASIQECFLATPEQSAAVLQSHETHVASQMAGAAFSKLVEAARGMKPHADAEILVATTTREEEEEGGEGEKTCAPLADVTDLSLPATRRPHGTQALQVALNITAQSPSRVCASVVVGRIETAG